MPSSRATAELARTDSYRLAEPDGDIRDDDNEGVGDAGLATCCSGATRAVGVAGAGTGVTHPPPVTLSVILASGEKRTVDSRYSYMCRTLREASITGTETASINCRSTVCTELTREDCDMTAC